MPDSAYSYQNLEGRASRSERRNLGESGLVGRSMNLVRGDYYLGSPTGRDQKKRRGSSEEAVRITGKKERFKWEWGILSPYKEGVREVERQWIVGPPFTELSIA